MSRAVLIGLGIAALLCVAGITAAAVAAKRDARDCSNADNPERCQHQQRLRAYCAEHPDDAHHCAADQGHDGDRMRQHCHDHPDDARCQAHDDADHDGRMREYCANHPDDAHHCS